MNFKNNILYIIAIIMLSYLVNYCFCIFVFRMCSEGRSFDVPNRVIDAVSCDNIRFDLHPRHCVYQGSMSLQLLYLKGYNKFFLR